MVSVAGNCYDISAREAMQLAWHNEAEDCLAENA
jgi:hypothetical protein